MVYLLNYGAKHELLFSHQRCRLRAINKIIALLSLRWGGGDIVRVYPNQLMPLHEFPYTEKKCLIPAFRAQ